MAVLEAASAGVPVIVSNMGGLPELAERIGARVVAARDVRALAGAVADVWSDAEGCRARAAAAWESARAHFDRDRHVDAIEGVYRAVMAPPAAAEPA
jgi:glycosyltransferase involved in cell wall biosynthesis